MNQNVFLGKKILYIDDEYVNYLYLSELLNHTKAEIFRAFSDDLVLHWIESNIDLSMVIVSSDYLEAFSFKLISQIKELNPNLTVTVILENQDSDLIQKCLARGCDLNVSRHIDSDDLIEIMNDAFKSNPENLTKALKSSEI